MKVLLRSICAVLMAFATTAQAQQFLTVQDAVRIGLAKNYDIQIARNNAAMAENTRGFGTAGLLPVLNASGNFDATASDLQTNNPFRPGGASDSETANAQVSLNWNLFDGFRMFADKKRYAELAELGELQAKSDIETIVLNIQRAYYTLVQEQQLLEVARKTRDISRARFEQEHVRRQLGSVSSTDLLNAQVAFNNDEAVLVNQELRVELAQKELNLLLVEPPEMAHEVEEEIEVRPLELALHTLLELMKAKNSDLQAMLKNQSVAHQDLRSARAGFLPTLALGASYGYTDQRISTGSDNPVFPDVLKNTSTDGRVTLTLSLNLFNGFRDRINYQNAQLLLRNRELAYKSQEEQFVALMHEKYTTFQKQVELVQLQEQNLAAARQNLQVQQDRYRMGTTTSLEFRDAQVNLVRAQWSLISAKFQARMTRLDIDKLAGRIQIN